MRSSSSAGATRIPSGVTKSFRPATDTCHETQEVLQLAGRAEAQLRRREGVQTQEVVASLERVAAEAIEVEPGAARDEDALAPDTHGEF